MTAEIDMTKMYAIQLDGTHIGRTVKITYRKTVKSKADTVEPKLKITVVEHSRSGKVTLKPTSYSYNTYKYTYHTYPYHAVIEFLD